MIKFELSFKENNDPKLYSGSVQVLLSIVSDENDATLNEKIAAQTFQQGVESGVLLQGNEHVVQAASAAGNDVHEVERNVNHQMQRRNAHNN